MDFANKLKAANEIQSEIDEIKDVLNRLDEGGEITEMKLQNADVIYASNTTDPAVCAMKIAYTITLKKQLSKLINKQHSLFND